MKLTKILPLFGILLFVYIIYKIGLPSIVKSFAGLNYVYLLIAFLFALPVLLLQTCKWFAITKKQGIKMNFLEALKIQLISVFYGFVTPARLGSFIKIAYLQDRTHNLGKSSSSVVIDRALDLLSVLILASFGSLLLLTKFSRLLLYIVVICGIFLLAAFFFISKDRSTIILKLVYRKMLPDKFKAKARESFHAFYDSIPSYGFLPFLFLLNLITWVTIYSQIFLIAMALDIKISYYVLVLIVPISTLVSLVPVTIAGIGTREVSLITLFGFFGIQPAKVVTVSLLSMVIANAIPAFIGFLLSIKKEDIEKK